MEIEGSHKSEHVCSIKTGWRERKKKGWISLKFIFIFTLKWKEMMKCTKVLSIIHFAWWYNQFCTSCYQLTLICIPYKWMNTIYVLLLFHPNLQRSLETYPHPPTSLIIWLFKTVSFVFLSYLYQTPLNSLYFHLFLFVYFHLSYFSFIYWVLIFWQPKVLNT